MKQIYRAQRPHRTSLVSKGRSLLPGPLFLHRNNYLVFLDFLKIQSVKLLEKLDKRSPSYLKQKMTLDIDRCIETLKGCKPLSQDDSDDLCKKAEEIMSNEPNIIHTRSPVTVVGDIHGQFPDVLRLLELGGSIENTKYVFLGDYVDRGRHSVETIQLLLCYKVKYPNQIILQRGNHENFEINRSYGFYDECIRKYGNEIVWTNISKLYNYMPICSLIDDKIFCVHGGLSPSILYIEAIEGMNRLSDINNTGLMDLLWADPEPGQAGFASSSRGMGYTFGEDANNAFLHTNQLNYILRSHQLAQRGYDFFFTDKNCITVWSCPNYLYMCNNSASILKVNDGTKEIREPSDELTAVNEENQQKASEQQAIMARDNENLFIVWRQDGNRVEKS